MDTLTMLKQELLGPLEVRKTKAQKDRFIAWAAEYAQGLGLRVEVEESGKWIRSRNLVIGDPQRAKYLFTAHYDTCARLPFPNFMTPCCWPTLILTQGLLIVLFIALGGVTGFALGRCMRALDIAPAAAGLIAAAWSMAVCFGLMALMLAGPANPHTANDNTSGVVTVLLAMEALAGREDVAFVLFDNEEKGLLGSSAFVSRHPKAAKRAHVFQFDCVSDGETLLFTGSKAGMNSPSGERMTRALREAAAAHGRKTAFGHFPKVIYPSDQMLFARGTAFAALKGRRILYLDRIHTARDTVFDEENIRCLMQAIELFMERPVSTPLSESKSR